MESFFEVNVTFQPITNRIIGRQFFDEIRVHEFLGVLMPLEIGYRVGSAIKNLGLFSKSPGDFKMETMDF